MTTTLTPDSISEAELLARILEWVAIRSPTYEPPGVNRAMDAAAATMARLGARLTRRPGRDGYGDLLSARWPADAPEEGGVLVLGHLDTVHTAESVGADLAIRDAGERIYGPGIWDMKGGFRAAIFALETLLRAGRRPAAPLTFLFVPDEEVGSPSTREDIERIARAHQHVLVPEPSHDGGLVSGRHAFLRFTVTTRGRPAHAGATNREGVSAIRAMAGVVEEIERFSDFARGMTFAVGVIRGGQFVNVIPAACTAQVLCVAPDEASFAEVQRRMAGLARAGEGGVSVEVTPGPTRPLFRASAGTLELYGRAEKFAAEVGLRLTHGAFGGGSDGNFTGALGVPTLDGLGLEGAGLHTAEEHILRRSLVPRCWVLLRMLETVGAGAP